MEIRGSLELRGHNETESRLKKRCALFLLWSRVAYWELKENVKIVI